MKKLLFLIVIGAVFLTGSPAKGSLGFSPGTDNVMIQETAQSDYPNIAKYLANEKRESLIMEFGESCKENQGLFTVAKMVTQIDGGKGELFKASSRAKVTCEE